MNLEFPARQKRQLPLPCSPTRPGMVSPAIFLQPREQNRLLFLEKFRMFNPFLYPERSEGTLSSQDRFGSNSNQSLRTQICGPTRAKGDILAAIGLPPLHCVQGRDEKKSLRVPLCPLW